MTCFIFASLMFLLTLPSNAFSTNPNLPNLPASTNSSPNAIINHCYTPGSGGTPGIKPADPTDCTAALSVLVRAKDFAKPFRFSKNPRAMARTVPLGWQKTPDADCRIVVTCVNDRDTAVFRLADVAQAARDIMNNCVDQPDPYGRYPRLKWGGIAGLSAEETFYVAVAKPIRPERELEGANLSVIETG